MKNFSNLARTFAKELVILGFAAGVALAAGPKLIQWADETLAANGGCIEREEAMTMDWIEQVFGKSFLTRKSSMPVCPAEILKPK